MDILILIACIAFIPGIYGFWKGIGYVPTPKWAVTEMTNAVGELPEGSVVYDLGTGDGRLLWGLLGKTKNIQGVGYDLFWPVWLISKFRSFFDKRVTIAFQDFFKADFSKATHIVSFLHPKPFKSLIPLWEKQCTPGTVIISYMFRVPEWEHHLDREKSTKNIFIYRV